MRAWRWPVVALAVVLAACGGGSGTAPSPNTTTASPTSTTTAAPAVSSPTSAPVSASSTAVPKGSATAQLTFVGDAGLAGTATKPVVSCNSPGLDGTISIRLLAQPGDPAALFNITLTTGKITIIIASGSGTGYHARQFVGTGVTGYSAANGAQIDTTVTESPPAGSTPGTIGAITSLKGTVDCGNQTTGISNVTFTGATTEGPVQTGPSPFRVECDTASTGNFITLVGNITIGTTTTLWFTTFGPDSINVFESIAGPPLVTRQYLLKSPGASTLTATGVRAVGDLVEQAPAGGIAHTVHIAGDATCGATVNR